MNSLQKKELEILKEFIRVCKVLNLRYYLVCGSALGAEKYGGFIPWDDDLDVALPRPDYEIFVEKAQEMLPSHLFLQNHKTDKEYPNIFSKIRNSNTTFIETSVSKRNINHGIYIDVFPLDGYPEDERYRKKIEIEKKKYSLLRLCCLNVEHTWKTSLLVFIEKLLRIDKSFDKCVSTTEKAISKYNVYDSPIWCNHGNWQGVLEYAPKEQYGIGKQSVFEGIEVIIPEKIDEYLSQKYGDWRSDPPLEKQVGHHYHLICDCEKPYTNYVIR